MEKKEMRLAENETRVWECLSAASDGATAYELAGRLNWKITSVRPRLSMMVSKGLLSVSGKRLNEEYSGKYCSVYRRRNDTAGEKIDTGTPETVQL